jgi:hypothetical protein
VASRRMSSVSESGSSSSSSGVAEDLGCGSKEDIRSKSDETLSECRGS